METLCHYLCALSAEVGKSEFNSNVKRIYKDKNSFSI